MRNVKKGIADYHKIIRKDNNSRFDFTISDFMGIYELDSKPMEILINACMFGFSIGYKVAKAEMKGGK